MTNVLMHDGDHRVSKGVVGKQSALANALWRRVGEIALVFEDPRPLLFRTNGLGRRLPFVQPSRPAAMLMVKPRIAVLNTKPTSECASTTRRMPRPPTPTSEVCTATLMVNEK